MPASTRPSFRHELDPSPCPLRASSTPLLAGFTHPAHVALATVLTPSPRPVPPDRNAPLAARHHRSAGRPSPDSTTMTSPHNLYGCPHMRLQKNSRCQESAFKSRFF